MGLVRDALLVHQGSGRASFQAADERGDLPVLVGSVYQKLSRLPVELSMALLGEGCRDLPRLLPSKAPCSHLSSLSELEPVAFDGKALKHVPHLLKPTRKLQGKLLGGRVLAALTPDQGLVLAMNATLDAQGNDEPLVAKTVRQVRQQNPRPRLWIGDRQFSDLKLFERLSEEPDHFLIRQNRSLQFLPDPERLTMEGWDQRGRWFVQPWGWAGTEQQKKRRYVRRITLFQPEAEDPKDRELQLLMDLLDGKRYPAAELLAAYQQR